MYFITRGQDADRSSGSVGGGVSWQPNPSVSFGLGYDYRMADNYDGHEINAVLKVAF